MNGYKEIMFLQNLKGIGKAKIYKDYLRSISEGITISELKKQLSSGYAEDSLNSAERMAESAEYELRLRDDIKTVTVLDSEYPVKLHVQGNSKPLILYAKGDLEILRGDSIAIVGTRAPSDWSVKVEKQLVRKIVELSERVIVSGLAIGCDYVAHKECIDAGGKTIAVLPSGLDNITPSSNKELSEEIVRQGGLLLSEYYITMDATKYSYVNRDAIIAAISDATFAVECIINSGTMETVKHAEKYGKRIAAYITGFENRGRYEGNEHMVKEHGADSITDTDALAAFLKKITATDEMSLYDIGLTNV